MDFPVILRLLTEIMLQFQEEMDQCRLEVTSAAASLLPSTWPAFSPPGRLRHPLSFWTKQSKNST